MRKERLLARLPAPFKNNCRVVYPQVPDRFHALNVQGRDAGQLLILREAARVIAMRISFKVLKS